MQNNLNNIILSSRPYKLPVGLFTEEVMDRWFEKFAEYMILESCDVLAANNLYVYGTYQVLKEHFLDDEISRTKNTKNN